MNFSIGGSSKQKGLLSIQRSYSASYFVQGPDYKEKALKKVKKAEFDYWGFNGSKPDNFYKNKDGSLNMEHIVHRPKYPGRGNFHISFKK